MVSAIGRLSPDVATDRNRGHQVSANHSSCGQALENLLQGHGLFSVKPRHGASAPHCILSDFQKYFLTATPNQQYIDLVPSRYEGRFAIVTSAGWDCGGRGCAFRRTAHGRTAKSCGPGAAMLALSSWSYLRVTVTKKPAHRGEHEVSRKAIAQGMSECFRSPVCSCAPFFAQFGTRDRGCSVHPAFPAPSVWRVKEIRSQASGKSCRENAFTRHPGKNNANGSSTVLRRCSR
jgi:hypothetical protein